MDNLTRNRLSNSLPSEISSKECYINKTAEPMELSHSCFSMNRKRKKENPGTLYILCQKQHFLKNCDELPQNHRKKTHDNDRSFQDRPQTVGQPAITIHKPITLEIQIIYSSNTSSHLALIDSSDDGNFMDLETPDPTP